MNDDFFLEDEEFDDSVLNMGVGEDIEDKDEESDIDEVEIGEGIQESYFTLS